MVSDSSDDEPTPRLRPHRLQSQTERDLDGIRARRERQARPVRDQLGELEAAIGGVVQERLDDYVTKPHDIPDIGDVVLDRYNSDPAYRALWNRVDSARKDQRRSRTESANQITEAMGKRPPNERLTQAETRIKILWAIVAAIGTLAAGSAVTVAKGLYERGETDGQHEIRLQNVEHATDQLNHRLEQFERIFLIAPGAKP